MSDVRWEGLTHEEIYARVQTGPGRAASADAETAWGTVASTIRDVDAQLSRAANAIGVGWEGAAADNVRGGLTVMSNWALDAAGDAELTRDGISAQADAAAHVRAAMPPPRAAQWTQAVGQASTEAGLVLGVPNMGVLEDGMAGDRAAAVELMNRYTSDSSTNQRMMNYWTPPPSVVVETVTPGPTGPGGAAVTGLVPAALVPGTGGASGAVGAPGGTSGRTRLDPAPGTGLGAASGAAAGGQAGRDLSPGSVAGSGGVPAGRGPSGPDGVAPLIPGVPGAGGAGGTRPRTGLPGGVRPVVPGPPPAAALPNGAGLPRGTPGAAGGEVIAPVPRASASPGGTTPGAGLPGGAYAGGRLPGDPYAAAPLPGDGPSRATPGGVLGAPTGPAPRAPADGVAPGLLEPGAAAERLAGRGGTVPGAGFLPLGGMPMSSADQEHRRPDYLVDDTDVFAADRPFTPAVLGGDDHDR